MTRDQDFGHDPVMHQAEAYAQAMMRAQAVQSIDNILQGIAIPFTVFDQEALFEYMQVVMMLRTEEDSIFDNIDDCRFVIYQKLVEIDISKANGKTIVLVIHKHIKKKCS
eukprot:m51a1_g13034 hypothetical protein (110) ;mRNA; f:957-1354